MISQTNSQELKKGIKFFLIIIPILSLTNYVIFLFFTYLHSFISNGEEKSHDVYSFIMNQYGPALGALFISSCCLLFEASRLGWERSSLKRLLQCSDNSTRVDIFYMLLKTAMNTLSTKAPSAGVQLVIPGVTIPLWYGLIGLIVVMVVHELSHGVVARAEKLRLKSVGLVLFAVIPGAFVEPDEDELKKAPLLSRLRVYAAGSMANIVVALPCRPD